MQKLMESFIKYREHPMFKNVSDECLYLILQLLWIEEQMTPVVGFKRSID